MYNAPENLPQLIFEVANCHGGDYEILRNIVGSYGEIDYRPKAIKFQIFHFDTISLPDYQHYSTYKKLYFSPSEWEAIIAEAGKFGQVWIDVFDAYGVKIVGNNIECIDGIKIQASVLGNEEVLGGLRRLDLTSKKLAINVSGYDVDAIENFDRIFQKICPNLVLQIGFQSYPTNIEDTGLQKIGVLQERFPERQISIADHADALSDFAKLVPIYASLLGCAYIEKHFCIDRKAAQYDAFSALEPQEMQELCRRLLDVNSATTGLFVNFHESEYLRKSVQTPVLLTREPPGSLLNLKKLGFRRTSQLGLSWTDISAIQKGRKVLAHPVDALRTVASEDFRKARVGVIVACRMKSTRLPKKAILPLDGMASVERCLHQCLAIEAADEVVLATSDLPDDEVLADYVAGGRARFWQGDPDDVIGRYLGACDRLALDVVVRVTADCPLVSPEILGLLLEKHFETGADYTGAADCAVGTSGEIINVSALKRVKEYFGRAELSEYMTWYFRNNPEVFSLNIVDLPKEMVRDYRLTLDHPEDRDVFERIFKSLGARDSYYGLREVFDLLDENSEISAINSHIGIKYVIDRKLVETLDRDTKMTVPDDIER